MMEKKPYPAVFYITALILSFSFLAGCGKGKSDVETEVPKEVKDVQKVKEVKPFLNPEVENVSGGEDFKGDKAAIRELIIRYNKAVAAAQISMDNLAALKGITTKKEFTRMYASIEQDRGEGKIMSCTLRNLAFVKISLKGENEGIVRTVEDWFFEDRDVKTGAIITSLTDTEYEVEYSVVKMEGRWLVKAIDLKKVAEYMPPRGEPKRVEVKTDREVVR